MATQQQATHQHERGPHWFVTTNIGFALTITATIAISVIITVMVTNNFFSFDEGWELDSSTTSTTHAVKIANEATIGELEVQGDVRITGSELQMVASDCSEIAPAGWVYLCFNGTEIRISENGGDYRGLNGTDGVNGTNGTNGQDGEDGIDGRPGNSARLWVDDDAIHLRDVRTQVLVLGTGFPANEPVELRLVTPDGKEEPAGRVTADRNGAFEARPLLQDSGDGVYTLKADFVEGEATHPMLGDGPDEEYDPG